MRIAEIWDAIRSVLFETPKFEELKGRKEEKRKQGPEEEEKKSEHSDAYDATFQRAHIADPSFDGIGRRTIQKRPEEERQEK